MLHTELLCVVLYIDNVQPTNLKQVRPAREGQTKMLSSVTTAPADLLVYWGLVVKVEPTSSLNRIETLPTAAAAAAAAAAEKEVSTRVDPLIIPQYNYIIHCMIHCVEHT